MSRFFKQIDIPVKHNYSVDVTSLAFDQVPDLPDLATITSLHVNVVSPVRFKITILGEHPACVYERSPYFCDAPKDSKSILASATGHQQGNLYSADLRTNKCHVRLQRDKLSECELYVTIQFECCESYHSEVNAHVLVEGMVEPNWQVVQSGKQLTSTGSCALGKQVAFGGFSSGHSKKPSQQKRKKAVKKGKGKMKSKGKFTALKRLAAKARKSKKTASGKIGKKSKGKKSKKTKKSKKGKKQSALSQPALFPPPLPLRV